MDQIINIFVSYAPQDESVVEDLRNALSLRGFNTVNRRATDEDSWNAVERSDFFLVCLSRNAVDSRGKLLSEMQKEVAHLWQGVNFAAFLIAVRLDDCPVPESLIAFEPIDLFTEGGQDKLF